jgi:hypothetical protein
MNSMLEIDTNHAVSRTLRCLRQVLEIIGFAIRQSMVDVVSRIASELVDVPK